MFEKRLAIALRTVVAEVHVDGVLKLSKLESCATVETSLVRTWEKYMPMYLHDPIEAFRVRCAKTHPPLRLTQRRQLRRE